jgi:hypothetical protein
MTTRALAGWPRAPILAPALVVAAVACAPAEPQRFPAKPPGCTLETVKTLPQRPYIELETFILASPESIRAVLDTVQERACHIGADAIYAPKAGRAYVYAIALRWNDAPAAAAPRAP